MAQPPVDRAREAAVEQVEKARLTFRRLAGIDRSGPPPPATLPGAPWHVWTLPNGIGIIRLALIPLFLVLGLTNETRGDPVPAVLFAVIAWADYADGIAARVTGQYSRFGALLDPVVDRLLIISGGAVCWYHELLPRWALIVLVLREVFMLTAGRYALRRGAELRINWWGRLAVTPIMAAIFAGLVGWTTLGAGLIYLGLFMAIVATAEYSRSAYRQLYGRSA